MSKKRQKKTAIAIPRASDITSLKQESTGTKSATGPRFHHQAKVLLKWLLVVLVPTIGAYFGLIEYFRSKLVIEVHAQDKESALDSFFKIQNQGSFTLTRVEYRCDVLNTKLDHAPKDPRCRNFTIYGIPAFWCIRHEEGARLDARNVGFDEGYAERDLEPGEVDTDQMCRNPLIPLPSFLNSEGQAIELNISYSVPWLALRSEKSFQFALTKGPEGSLAWFPISKARR